MALWAWWPRFRCEVCLSGSILVEWRLMVLLLMIKVVSMPAFSYSGKCADHGHAGGLGVSVLWTVSEDEKLTSDQHPRKSLPSRGLVHQLHGLFGQEVFRQQINQGGIDE